MNVPRERMTREQIKEAKLRTAKKMRSDSETKQKARQEKLEAYLDNKRAWEKALGKKTLRFRKMPRYVVLRKALKKSGMGRNRLKVLSNVRLRQVAATGSIPSMADLR
jgi:hypothetical protein